VRLAICLLALLGAVVGPGPAPGGDPHVRDLRSSVPAVRRRAAATLGQVGDRSAVPALVEALGDSDGGVRREAAKALGFIKDRRAAPGLIAALGDPEVNVRLLAAYALGEIKDARAARPLLDALDDPEWCVRNQAAWGLRELGDPAMAAPLAAALQKEDADVAHVVWLLRHLPAEAAVPAVASLLSAPEATTRVRAVAALSRIEAETVVEPLLGALGDESREVRRAAVAALGKAGDDRAEAPIAKLAAGDPDPAVRQAAREALLQMSRRKDLAAHWSFDDRNAQIAKDVTGRGNDGRIVGCEPVEGKVGHALRFGRGKYVELGKPAGLPIAEQPFTVTAWAKSDAPRGVVVARGGAFCGFSLYLIDGVPKFGIHRVQDGPAHIAAGRGSVAGSWVHLAGVVRSDRIELYVNGKLAATEKTPGYIPSNCGQGMEIGFDVGNSPAEITDPFEGVIDEVKIFLAALSEEEIAKEMAKDEVPRS